MQIRLFFATLLLRQCVAAINGHLIISADSNPLVGIKDLPVIGTGRFDSQFLDLVSDLLNFTYDIRPPKDVLASGNLLRNGSWTGGLGQLQRQEVDAYISVAAASLQKYQVADISFPIFQDEVVIIIPFPEERSKTMLISAPFSKEVWIALTVAFVVVPIALSLLSRSNEAKLNEWIIFAIASLTGQDFYIRGNRHSIRILASGWLLSCVVLVYSFTALYTSLLTVSIYKPSINSIDDVAAHQLRVYTLKGVSTEEYILNSKNGSLKFIGDQLRSNQRQSIDLINIAKVSTLISSKSVFVVRKVLADSIVADDFLQQKKCTLTLARESFYKRSQCIFLQKNSPLTPRFNRMILLLQQFGFIERAVKRAASFSKSPCDQRRMMAQGEKRKFNLRDFSAAFVIWIIGLSLAFLAFACELIKKKYF